MPEVTRLCARCGANPRNSSLKSYCVDCKRALCRESRLRTGASKQEVCSRCRGIRTGAHPTYCQPCLSAWKAEKAQLCSRCKKPRERGEGTQFAYCPRCQRDVWMRRKYGISVDQYEERLEAQAHRCALCSCPENGRQWHVDHSHTTGAVRGILCDNCNRGLGHFKDDAAILRRAADYLER